MLYDHNGDNYFIEWIAGQLGRYIIAFIIAIVILMVINRLLELKDIIIPCIGKVIFLIVVEILLSVFLLQEQPQWMNSIILIIGKVILFAIGIVVNCIGAVVDFIIQVVSKFLP